MLKPYITRLFSGLTLLLLSGFLLHAQLPTPESHFGFQPGADRMMFNYETLISYMEKLAEASGKVHMEQIGETELGRPMYLIFISSEENIARLEELREINRRLAMDDIPDGMTRDDLVKEGRVFFLSTLSMHANEVGPVQALPLVAWELLNGTDPRREKILEHTVAMFIPHNPDGMNMVVEHYNKHKGTPLEGSSLPGVYHKYVGHNINRDFVTLSQSENQAVAAVYSTEWYPQAMVERHQMGSTGPRFYVSPPHDPIAENVDAGIWNWMRIYGSRALTEMTDAGLASVSVNYLFDDYWPGATTTSIWKGIVGMLSEAAGVNTASPIYVEPNELRPIGKGLSEYAISINMPRPWEGGWWRLSDILRYELENTLSYLHTSALHQKEILTFRNELSRREIRRGKEEAPFFYVLPQQQHDLSEMLELLSLLDRHGVKSYRLTGDARFGHRTYSAGDVVIPLAQPYRAFIKEMLEAQRFPARHYTPGGEMIRPYDITSWSLPLHRGVEAVAINERAEQLEQLLTPVDIPLRLHHEKPEGAEWALFSINHNESFKAAFLAMELGMDVERIRGNARVDGRDLPAGSFLVRTSRRFDELTDALLAGPVYLMDKPEVQTSKLTVPRIGLVETWFHDMDGGWTRFLFDQYHIPYTVLRPADLQTANLKGYDIIIFSDARSSVLKDGQSERRPSTYPPEYNKGMDKKGFENLLRYINEGGKVMAWGPAVELFTGTLSIGEGDNKESFLLPFSNTGSALSGNGLYVPGSLLRVNLLQDHPLTLGMPEQIGVFHRGNPVFRTSIPYFDMDRRVIASFTDDNILMSGYAEKEELLKNQAALLWIQKGKGQLILSSFNPQFRASTPVTYKLLFNAVLID
jgi:hypothetical protein